MHFQFYGWAVIRSNFRDPSTFENERDDETAEKKAIEAIETYLGERYTFPFQFGWSNGLKFLNTSGCSNHYRGAPMELFEFIRDITSGSYGLLYVHNAEDEEGWDNLFQAWVLKKGSLTRARDSFLSPIEPEIEEY